MARDMNLKDPAQAARLAQATGQNRGARPGGKNPVLTPAPKPVSKDRVPLPAKGLPPGVTGVPPLPGPGRVVSSIAPSSLTPLERKTFEAAGWTEDVPIPANAAQLLAESQTRYREEEVMLPVGPGTPAVEFDPQPMANLTPERQQEFRQKMAHAAQMMKAQATTTPVAPQSSIPGLAEAQAMADRVQMQNQVDDTIEITDVPEAEPPEPPVQRTQTSQSPSSKPASDTGADIRSDVCPHCLVDRRDAQVAEPPYADKLAFLQAMCGQRPWTKSYELYGGNAILTLRTLTIREVNELYRQTYEDQRSGKFENEVDFYEQLNRYRLFLQIIAFRWMGADGFNHDLADALTPDTNEFGTGFWDRKPLNEQEDPILPRIEKFMIDEVFKTEQLLRAVNLVCGGFNRLAAKMEAVAQDSDFWKPTGEPS